MINVIKNSDLYDYNNLKYITYKTFYTLFSQIHSIFLRGGGVFGNFETSAGILNDVKWQSLRINFHGALNFEHCPLQSKLPLFPSSQQPFMWTGC